MVVTIDEKFWNYRKEDKQRKVKESCIRCFGNNTFKNGKKKYKEKEMQAYICKDCIKSFFLTFEA